MIDKWRRGDKTSLLKAKKMLIVTVGLFTISK
jgi:hypothetical protein